MNIKMGLSKTSYNIFIDRLEETITNKKIFLDWSSVSMFGQSLTDNKQSFYSFDVCKRIERTEEIHFDAHKATERTMEIKELLIKHYYPF